MYFACPVKLFCYFTGVNFGMQSRGDLTPCPLGIGLELKYVDGGQRLLERIKAASLLEKLEAIKEAVKVSKNIEEIEDLL